LEDPQPLEGLLVVDLSRYLPGPFATRELLRLGARVVRLEPPDGDPVRWFAPEWEDLLNAGKESVGCDLKAEPELGRALCARADVVVESFRPGVAARLGVGPDDVPASAVYCSITGFGVEGPRVRQAGHDLNYVGYAGLLATTAPALPPVPVADLAGAFDAVRVILAALLDRERTGRGARLTVSLTGAAARLAPYGGPRLTGQLACYRIYRTADGRRLTVAALERPFFARLCELVGKPGLVERQYDPEAQEALAAELEEVFAARPLATWLELFEGEDVAVGPVLTLEEAETEPPAGRAAPLGEHTARWRRELGLA
jgi:crotonobetainyl-CoA:carnitine CoA-transferase CaiB-like acyl-CoA transferase